MIPVVRVLAPNPDVYTLEGTNTWVVGADPAIVIDPGPVIEAHLEEIERTAGPVAHVLVTHDHPDHAPGAATFAERAGASLWAARLDGAARIRDGATFAAGGVELAAIATPGHTSDHVAFFEPIAGALFTGDAVLGRGTSVIDPPEGDLVRYLASLRTMLDLSPRTIYPGHGPVVVDARAKLTEYLDHREQREQQVLAVLADGGATIEQLVGRIYQGYPAEALPLAGRSMLAHLRKLEAEGRATGRGRGNARTWSPAEPSACARCGKPVRGRVRYCPSCSIVVLQEGAAPPDVAEPHTD